MQTANPEQIEYWNQLAGPKWAALAERIDAQIDPIGLEAQRRAAVRAGERVLDVGCGCGQTSLQLAGAVGPTGRVLGIDVSAPMLALARERAQRAGLAHCDFVQADAQVYDFGSARFGLVYSRFGVMFFSDPAAAFANLRRTLAPDGRCVFVCWQALVQNPWMTLPLQAVAQHCTLPAAADPHAPGPFAFADPERLRALLARAGFSDITIEPFGGHLAIGRGESLDSIVVFLQQIGPAAAALRDADTALRERVGASMREALEPHYRGTAVELGFACWIVRAR